MAELEVVDKQGKKSYGLATESDIAIIGRDRTCLVQIQDELSSRKHCRILKAGNTFVVEDLQSRNGTYVNEIQITGKRNLRDGDVVRIGQVRIVFRERLTAGGAMSWMVSSPLFWWCLMIGLAVGILGGIGYLVHKTLSELTKIRHEESVEDH
ncbi:MAG: FHA domain-containing protein [Planctomycetes bacterium]|nr:FHA domain-containing protein [Planctomycetota bacterium]